MFEGVQVSTVVAKEADGSPVRVPSEEKFKHIVSLYFLAAIAL
jgi:hypothetical protein